MTRDHAPNWLRLFAADRVVLTLATVATVTDAASVATQPTAASIALGLILLAAAATGFHCRATERAWFRATNALTEHIHGLDNRAMYLDRAGHTLYIRDRSPAWSFLFAIPEDQLGELTGGRGVLTGVCWRSPRLAPHMVERAPVGVTVDVGDDGEPRMVDMPARPWAEQVRGRWLAIRIGAVFPTVPELAAVTAGVGRVERFEPPEDEEVGA